MSQKLKEVEWEQDQHYLRLKIPLTGVSSMKSLDLYLSDCVLRINVASMKMVKVLDLFGHVDYLSKENKFVFTGDRLECSITKATPSVWDSLLVQGLNKPALVARRAESFKRREQQQEEFIEKMKDLRIHQDKFSTQEQMRIEDEERQNLMALKAKEKRDAEEFIYADIEEENTLDKDIFDRDPKGEIMERKILPAIRSQANKIDIGFTEKVYGNLASREQHLQEAPLPQLKKMAQNKSNKLNMNEIKNPEWLKDKGNELMKKGEYLGAINAYKNAFKLAPTQLGSLSNLCLAHLHMFNYNEAHMYAHMVIQAIDDLPAEERLPHAALRLKNQVRQAMCLAWRGDIKDSLQSLDSILTMTLSDEVKQQVQSIHDKVKIRVEQYDLKVQGNQQQQLGRLDQALTTYKTALELAPNETLLANVSLILVQQEKYEEALEYCQQALDMMAALVNTQNIIQDINNNYDKAFDATLTLETLVKQLFRKAKLLHRLQRLDEAQVVCREVIALDLQNKETRALQAQLTKEQNQVAFQSEKQQATDLMAQGEMGQALNMLKQAQGRLEKDQVFELLAIMLNKCVCFMKLSRWDDTVSACNTGLNILNNYSSRVIAFSHKEHAAKVTQYQKTFLVRRGNSYLKLSQFYNAKQDLEDALRLSPQDEKLKEDIYALKQAIQNL